jgi:uncharacterized protein
MGTETSGADRPYFEALSKGELCLPACKGCGRWHWPAVFRCADCGSWEIEWKQVDPIGTIYTWTRTHHRFAGAEAFVAPFVSLVISLDRAPSIRLLGTLEGAADGFRIGSRVRGRVRTVEYLGEEVPALSWTLI